MDIDTLKQQKQLLNNKVDWLDEVIRTYVDDRRNGMGLVNDEVKTPAYSALKRERAAAFENLRQFNGKYAKTIHQTIRP